MNKFLFILIGLGLYIQAILPCTTAVISGKCTVDGRPLLFKHRDTGFAQNKLMYFDDGKFEYIGLVNAKDSTGNEVWAGFNHAGFGIMNSEAYNLNIGDTAKLRDMEGVLMKRALQECATLAEFELFLDNYARPRGVRANFGVIDAQGGAAYYETGHDKWVKFDANDPAQAPSGYLIRTNFAMSGVPDKGYGYIRYQTARDLFQQQSDSVSLDHIFITQQVSRSLKHSLLKHDLSADPPGASTEPYYVFFEDYIPRYASAATTVVQGVKAGETPRLTTLWTILGFQLCSVTIPVWLNDARKLPAVLIGVSATNAPLCDYALQLKQKCFPVTRGSGKRYLNLAAVFNRNGSGILQRVLPIEAEILTKSDKVLKELRANPSNQQKILQFYDWIDLFVKNSYVRLLK